MEQADARCIRTVGMEGSPRLCPGFDGQRHGRQPNPPIGEEIAEPPMQFLPPVRRVKFDNSAH
jgi:hypothetical protein